ncbi:Pentatricopeptide repeat [Macleaya cordata]|uniref:Pentatricopeptide repeat n=1 Tax=Macleaya cordata TaxID=56857 RepID=A0A200R4E6_MACCD|nr:Pentatricopeptide repeat [Macleaya cordata]
MMHSSLTFVQTKTPLVPRKNNPNNNRTREQLENQAFSWLQSCTTFKQMTQIHAHIIRNSIHQNNFVATKLVSFCFTSNNPSYATRVFYQVPDPNTFLWNNMIKGFVHVGSYQDALIFYFKMLNHGSKPNNFTYPFLLKACSKVLAFEEGKILHGHILKLGLNSDVYVQTSLLDLYGACGTIMAARLLFDRMSERDVVAWNAMLVGYTRSGLVEIAEQLFEQMPVRNVSSWTTMIAAYVQIENSRKALEVFQEMQNDGVKPDKLTIITVLSAISDLGSLEMGKWVHDYVKSNEVEIDTFVGTSLIDMYSKCGSITEAKNVFDRINPKAISCYNAMISGYAVHGLGEEAIKVFREAERLRIGIDDVTLIGVLSACSHSGLVDLGCMYFESMSEKYGIEPKMEHYGCLVDLLGRAGRFDEAMEIVESIEADIVLLGTLAFACRIHGNVELGEELARRMYELDPANSGLLVLKSNLFAVEGRWEEAAEVRRSMKDRGIWKKPGCSWIEVNNVVHEFVAGDDSHPCSKEIYKKLAELSEKMKRLIASKNERLKLC